MALEPGKITLVPLNEKNYATWKVQIKMHLMKDDLFGIVKGREVAPSTDTTAVRKFELRRDRALATIVLAVEPKLLYLIGDPTDPSVVWQKLQDTFQKKSWANKFRLKRKLYSMKLKPGDDLQVHLKTFVEIFEELAVIGDPIQDEDRVINLLASLPDDYSTLVTALEAMEKVPSWESVTERLLHEENKIKGDRSCSSVRSNPRPIQENEKSLVTKQKRSKPVKCFECNKTGHVKKDCYIFIERCKKKKENYDKNHGYKGKQSLVVKGQDSDDEVTLFVSAVATGDTNTDSWLLDSGASQHMCNNKELFSNLVNICTSVKVEVGDGRSLTAVGQGSVVLKVNLPNNKVETRILNNVLYVPDLAYNLISVSQVTLGGKVTNFYENSCKILNKKSKLLAVGKKLGKLYVLDCFQKAVAQCSNVISDEILWHRRFCHLGINNVRKLISKELVDGIDFKITKDSYVCENCNDGKIHRTPFPIRESNEHKVLDLIHSDVCGKLNPGSLGGGNYFVTFIDDASRYVWVYIINNKSDVFDVFKSWKALVENQYEKKIKILRTDNGGEYTSVEFEGYLKDEGIRHEKTIPKTPEQNGVAERMNRTLVETVRAMLSDSKLPKVFWGEALSTAAYVRNRSPTSSLKDKTPYEVLNGRKPNVKHLRIFGCVSHVHIPKDEREKLDSKSKKCILLGYGSTTKGYRLYNLDTKKVFHSRDVVFDECQSVSFEKESVSENSYNPKPNYVEFDVSHEDNIEKLTEPEINPRRSVRERKEPSRLGEWVNTCIGDMSEPSTVEEALSGSEAEKWKRAMQNEMNSIYQNDVWSLVESSSQHKPINCKWIFKRKVGADGNICSYKARLVAQGFSQKLGIDYDETFSPVVRFESVRSLLALAAQHNLHVHQMDVSSAFLNGNLSEELYMTQPKGFIEKGKENLVCKLNKAIYGLKQAPKCWNASLDKYLKSLKFKQSSSDSCIYTNVSNDILCIIAVYVDDIIIVCESLDYLKEMKTSLSNKYKMKDLGKLNYFLGVSIVQDDDHIFINQSAYIQSLLKKYGMENSKPVLTPIEVNCILEKAVDDSDLFDLETYQSAVGSLMYLSTRTRPDITYAVCNVAKFCTKPTRTHWSAVKRIFRYLRGTDDLGILYSKDTTRSCVGYSDADWAGDRNDRKSTSGYCFLLGSGLISWRTTKQSCVALSTAEAEYVALSGAAQEAVWLMSLFKDLHFDKKDPMLIYEDNQSAICLAKNPKNHPKTKHISIKFHYVRDLVASDQIEVKYCPTSDMLADIFTKGLFAEKFCKLRLMLGVHSLEKHTQCEKEC